MIFLTTLQKSRKLNDVAATVAFSVFFVMLAFCGLFYIWTAAALTEQKDKSRILQNVLSTLDETVSRVTDAGQKATESNGAAADLITFRENFDALFVSSHSNQNTSKIDPSKITQLAAVITEIDGLVQFVYPVDADLLAALPGLMVRTTAIAIQIKSLQIDAATTFLETQTKNNQKALRYLNFLSVAGLLSFLTFIGSFALMRLQYLSALSGRIAHDRVRATLAKTVSFSSDPIILVNRGGDILESNHEAINLWGSWPPVSKLSDVTDRIDQAVGGIALTDAVEHAFAQQAIQDTATVVNFDLRTEDGSLHPIEANLILQSEQTLLIALKNLSKQINFKKKMEDTLTEMRGEEQTTARFMAIMSHELRTPLNGIMASIELLKETTELDDQQTWLTEISENYSKAAVEQLGNLLELNQLLNPNRTKLSTAAFSLAETIHSVVNDQQSVAKTQNNRLVFRKPAQDSHLVLGSERLFALTLTHLVTSAVKFNKFGKIEVALSTDVDTQNGTLKVDIMISDTGSGIPLAGMQPIFENFKSLETAYTKTGGGSGLSLGIAKRAAEIMGGQIFVDTAVNRGTKFSIKLELPLVQTSKKADVKSAFALPAKEVQKTSDIDPEKPLRLLVAEDDEIYRSMLIASLHLDGHDIVEAKDGQEAIDLAQKGHFDAVLMDISMPHISGITATKIIRQSSAPRFTKRKYRGDCHHDQTKSRLD
jgi:signal transduction histidine kinase